MSLLVDTLARKHISQDVINLSVTRLPGGISSENYKVGGLNNDGMQVIPQVMTVIRDKNNWWKIEKEENIRKLLGDDPEVLLPKLIQTGIDKIGTTELAFMFSEFISGKDLDNFLESNLTKAEGTNKLSGIARDLGYRIGALHKHKSEVTGLIGCQLENYNSWNEYVMSVFEREVKLIGQVDETLRIGSVKMFDLQSKLPLLQKLVGGLESELDTSDPKTTHGDARFGNFMADHSEDESWRIKSMIDLEAMLGGDPEIDVAFMENWLHFSSYKKEFFAEKESFLNGYKTTQKVSANYHKKRLVYHTIRSLAYLRTVFGFDIDSFLKVDSRHKRYVEQHMEIVQSLAQGNYMEDIGILPLI